MKLIIVMCILVAVGGCLAKQRRTPTPCQESGIVFPSSNDTTAEREAKGFVAKVVHSYIGGTGEVSFPIADDIIALDNGTVLSKLEFQKAWPKFCQVAFNRKMTQEDYFEGVNLKVLSPGEAGLLEHEYLAGVYHPEEGDLLVDGSQVKEGVDDFIGYEKGFIFMIRKVKGSWTLVAIGG